MIEIKMIRHDRGTDDGINIKEYEAGKVYKVTYAMYQAFVKHRGTAVEYIPEDKQPVVETAPVVEQEKAVVKASKNKAVTKYKKKNS